MAAHPGSYRKLLSEREFLAFLSTLFWGAFNDNCFKMVLMLLITSSVAVEMQSRYLSMVSILFIAPFILFVGFAGFCADRFRKKHVMVALKSGEVLTMLLGLVGFWTGSMPFLMLVLFLMAAQSAFFSPAKYGIIPEYFESTELSRVNGCLELATFVGIIIGSAVGGVLVHIWSESLHWASLAMVSIAGIGLLSSLFIYSTPAADQTRSFSLFQWSEIASGMKYIVKAPILLLAVLANSYFWGLGIMTQIIIVQIGDQTLNLTDLGIAMMNTCLASGIGLGSLLAGRISGDKIEYGLIPFGCLMMAAAGFACYVWVEIAWANYLMFFIMGISGGLFIVPLFAILQDVPPVEDKGRIIAINNLFNAVAMMIGSSLMWLSGDLLQFSPPELLLEICVLTLLVSVVIIVAIPDWFIRLILVILTNTIYRVRVHGLEHVPTQGPALMVCNHVSYVDGLIISSSTPRFLRFLVGYRYYHNAIFHGLFKLAKAIPVYTGSPEDTAKTIVRARRALQAGDVVCIFAEGRLTRTGNLLPFKSGVEKILEGLDVPIIPVYLDELWDSVFAFRNGKVFWKLPRRLPFKVTVAFGEPCGRDVAAWELRQRVQELGALTNARTKTDHDFPFEEFLRSAKMRPWRFSLADNLGHRSRYGHDAVSVLCCAHYLVKTYPSEQTVALLIPPSRLAVIWQLAVTGAGKVAMNVPSDCCRDDLQALLNEAGVNVVLSTHESIAQLGLSDLDGVVCVEDLPIEISGSRRLLMQCQLQCFPVRKLWAWYGKVPTSPSQTIAVCYTRGTTGRRKAVALSHRGVYANINNLNKVLQLQSDDVFFGSIAFSSAFAYSGSLWYPMILGASAVFHRWREDIKAMGYLCVQHRVSVMMDTPEGYARYLEEMRPDNFSFLRYAVVGGGEVDEDFIHAFRNQFSTELYLGYGMTELGPAVSLNTPDVRQHGQLQRGSKIGSAGLPIPGVAVKVVSETNFERLPPGQMGLLLVKSQSLFSHYLNTDQQPTFHDGWFVTGDRATIDADGFLYVEGRCTQAT